MRYSYLNFIVNILLITVCFYLYNINQKEEKKFQNKLKQIDREKLFEDRIFNEDFKLKSFEIFIQSKNTFENSKKIVIYANLTGCGKCIEHHLHLASKLKDFPNIVFIFYAYNKAQINRMIKYYHIKSNVYFDKYDQISKLFGSDTRNINPFVLFIYNERVFKLKFSYENDNIYLNDLVKYLR